MHSAPATLTTAPARHLLTGAIALLEGVTTLGFELYALRVCSTVIGSSTSVTGIVLGVILIALSTGYWRGGHAAATLARERADRSTVMRAVANRLGLAALLYGLLIPMHRPMMSLSYDLSGSIELAALLSALLYAPGVIAASGVLPLLAETRHGSAGQSAGSFLAISTIGSVIGSAAVPVLLFPSIGVRLSGLSMIAVLLLATAVASWAWRRG